MRYLLVVAALLAPQPARAELWASSMGDLLHDAKRIEIIAVTAVKDHAIDGTLALAQRSTGKVGDKVHLDIGFLPPPKVGDRLLVICDSECPRAIGVEHDGTFQVIAQQPMDGAFVTPNIVRTTSLASLAAGQPAADLCVRGVVELLDEMVRPTFEVKINAGDGRGHGTLAGHRVGAALTVVWFASETGAIEVRLSGKAGVELVAARVGTDPDGCSSGQFLPSRPLARTARALDRALDGTTRAVPIARGTLTVGKGAPVAAGAHALAFTVTADGYLELASDLAEGRVSHVQHDAGHYGLGFGTKRGSPNDPELFLDFAIAIPAGYEHGAGLAKAVRARPTAKASWIQGAKRTELGSITLDYVREPTSP